MGGRKVRRGGILFHVSLYSRIFPHICMLNLIYSIVPLVYIYIHIQGAAPNAATALAPTKKLGAMCARRIPTPCFCLLVSWKCGFHACAFWAPKSKQHLEKTMKITENLVLGPPFGTQGHPNDYLGGPSRGPGTHKAPWVNKIIAKGTFSSRDTIFCNFQIKITKKTISRFVLFESCGKRFSFETIAEKRATRDP